MKQNAFCPPNLTVLTPSNTDQLDTKGFFFCKTPKGQRVFVHINNSPYLTPLSAKKYGPQPPVSQSVKGQIFVGRVVETPKGLNAEELRPFPSHYEWDAEGNFVGYYHTGIDPQKGNARSYSGDTAFWPQGLRDIATAAEAVREAALSKERQERDAKINAIKSVLQSYTVADYMSLPQTEKVGTTATHRGVIGGLDVWARIETRATFPQIVAPYVEVELSYHATISADGGFNSVTIVEPAGTERRPSPIEPDGIVDAFENPDRPIEFKVGSYGILTVPRSEVELIAHPPYLEKRLTVSQKLEMIWGGRSFTETHNILWDGSAAWGGRIEDFSKPRPFTRFRHDETSQPCIRYNPVYGGYDLADILAKRLAIETANTTEPVLKWAKLGSGCAIYDRNDKTIWSGGPYMHMVYTVGGYEFNHHIHWTGNEARFWLELRSTMGPVVPVSQLERVCQSMIDQLKSGQYGIMYGGVGLVDVSYSSLRDRLTNLPGALYIDPDSRTQHILLPEWALTHIGYNDTDVRPVIAREFGETDRQKHRLSRLSVPTYYMKMEPQDRRRPDEAPQSKDSTPLENIPPTRTVWNTWEEEVSRPSVAIGQGMTVDVTANDTIYTHIVYSDGTREQLKREAVTKKAIELHPYSNQPVFGPVRLGTDRRGRVEARSVLGEKFDRLGVEDKRPVVQYNVDGLLSLNPTLWGITWSGNQMFAYTLPDGSKCAAAFDRVSYQITLFTHYPNQPETFIASDNAKAMGGVAENPTTKGKTFAQYMKERIGKK